MTLTEAALNVLSATHSGVLENMEQPLSELDMLLASAMTSTELSSAKSILEDARKAAYTHRSQIVRSLQTLERSNLYTGSSPGLVTSWEMSG